MEKTIMNKAKMRKSLTPEEREAIIQDIIETLRRLAEEKD